MYCIDRDLGRAFDLAKAASHYSSSIDLWTNADPELQPTVQDAKRRLAAMQAREKR